MAQGCVIRQTGRTALRRPYTSPAGQSPSPTPSGSFLRRNMQAFRQLAHKYGKVATIVYFGVSTVDLGLSIWAVRAAGEERVKKLENWLTDKLGDWALFGREPSKVFQQEGSDQASREEGSGSGGAPSWTSTLLIGYSIHKLLMPVRVPITVMLTPSIAAKFRQFGYFLPKK
ncbi:DUF1279 super [Tieghemiomyces parasiticus]|uniref:DUF1279 super n=1 Tax=Tieghemiomyces parasiticus TaxID=78921 RepID=A0A9W8E345_9FUNG|nr:DUF1279 super [Tieghemiomyces parasiticus]KAJ1929882.1 DUF1279 super [Tieghemiomyces parasiticus]